MSDTVTRDDADGVATLTLQRPGLSSALRMDLLAASGRSRADESVRAVLLTGTGRAFCVGQDLAEHLESLRGNAATSLNVVVEEYNPLILALAALRVPVVVGDQRRLRRGRARASRWPATCGSPRPGRSSRPRSPASGCPATRRWPPGWCTASAAHGRRSCCCCRSRSSPRPREQWGLVHRVVPAEQVLDEAQALAARLAAGPTAAYRAVKTVLATAATDSLEETLALEARLQTELGRTADHREAVEAFLAKRAPEFTGALTRLACDGHAAGLRASSPPGRAGRSAAGRQRVRVAQAGQTSRAATGHCSSVDDPGERAAERELAGAVDLGWAGGAARPRATARRSGRGRGCARRRRRRRATRVLARSCGRRSADPRPQLRPAGVSSPRRGSRTPVRAPDPGQDAGHGADQARPRLRRPRARATAGWSSTRAPSPTRPRSRARAPS